MGYFSNGIEGADYESRFCVNCVHYDRALGEDPPCPVWLAHLVFNYDQHKNPEIADVLNMLIPRDDDGLGNKQCVMFFGRDGATPGQIGLEGLATA